ncbi:YnbE family lipoprotein [Novosphingobium sp. ZW T3_23]|uniref:YnbE family lipoprotein n=1 Tax=Novosphingobium sp. ZW T3_23 TaxID=3378084 RepID=UPI003851935B
MSQLRDIAQQFALRSGRRAVRALVMMTGVGSALAGCVNVTAPDKPIVIELNINIRQEVIYRLSQDAENTIKENEGVF